jgi:hypothetical protein
MRGGRPLKRYTCFSYHRMHLGPVETRRCLTKALLVRYSRMPYRDDNPSKSHRVGYHRWEERENTGLWGLERAETRIVKSIRLACLANSCHLNSQVQHLDARHLRTARQLVPRNVSGRWAASRSPFPNCCQEDAKSSRTTWNHTLPLPQAVSGHSF